MKMLSDSALQAVGNLPSVSGIHVVLMQTALATLSHNYPVDAAMRCTR